MKWSYGVTTVPERFSDLLPRTLASLAKGGFSEPRVFVDGKGILPPYLEGLLVTQRSVAIRAYGAWVASAWELFASEPNADRYAIFQDDFVCSSGLREYLEASPYPERGYLNLYTVPVNTRSTKGWYLSNQLGKGALALVFNRETLMTLLKHQHLVDHVLDCRRGHRSIDGAVVSALGKEGIPEWVHNPSLVQHIGTVSSIGNTFKTVASTFRGEDFDCKELLSELPDRR